MESFRTHLKTNTRNRILVPLLFSFLPILCAIGAICIGLSMLLVVWPLSNKDFFFAGLSFSALAAFLANTLSPLAYRFVMRALPLKASGEVNPRSLRILHLAITVLVIGCLSVSYHVWQYAAFLASPSGANIFDAAVSQVGSYVALSLLSIILLFLVCLTYGLVKAASLHRQPGVWAQQGFILFLRSFGSVSDSAALGPLVRGASGSLRVAFLSPPKALMTSWDPNTLALSGFNLRQPFQSSPVYLESTDDYWQDDVRRLVESANLVVIDTSQTTPGISEEIAMLREHGIDKKIVQIEEATDQTAASDSYGALHGEIIFVKRHTLMRRLSQISGFIFTYLGFVFLTVIAASLVDPMWSLTTEYVILSSLLYSVLPGIWSASALAPTAGFSRHSSEKVVNAIRSKLDRRGQCT